MREPLSGRVFVTGYEGTELAYARLLVEAGAEVPYVSTSIAPDPMVLPDEMWLSARHQGSGLSQGAGRGYGRARSLPARPGARHDALFQRGQGSGIPGLYFTNQLASRPFFLSGGMAPRWA